MAFNVNPSIARVGTKKFEKLVNPELPTLVVMEAPIKKGGNFKFNINQEALVLLGYTAEEAAAGECYVYLMAEDNNPENWLIAGKEAYARIVDISEAKNESVNVVMDRFSGCTGMNGNFSNKTLHGLFSNATGIDTAVKNFYELVLIEDGSESFPHAKLVKTTENVLKDRVSVKQLQEETVVNSAVNETVPEGAFKELLNEVAEF
jgi:hypothetical protein